MHITFLSHLFDIFFISHSEKKVGSITFTITSSFNKFFQSTPFYYFRHFFLKIRIPNNVIFHSFIINIELIINIKQSDRKIFYPINLGQDAYMYTETNSTKRKYSARFKF